VGTRVVTGDTPAPRIGETANLFQFGAHALWGFNPVFGVVADFAYGFRELEYSSSATVTDADTTSSSTIDNVSKSRGWDLNALFVARLPVGNHGGQLYAGPGVALINQEFRGEETNNGVVTVRDAKLGTNFGLAIGAGAIMPFAQKWHAFFSFRHTWVIGQFDESTSTSRPLPDPSTTTALKADVPIGGPGVLVGAGYNF
jgi:opacity protein-like surface antigen